MLNCISCINFSYSPLIPFNRSSGAVLKVYRNNIATEVGQIVSFVFPTYGNVTQLPKSPVLHRIRPDLAWGDLLQHKDTFFVNGMTSFRINL